MNGLAWAVAIAIGAISLALGVALDRSSQRRVLRDARERAEAESAAAERRARAADEDRRIKDLTFATMRDGVLLFDATRRLAFANGAAERHLGQRPGGTPHVLPIAVRDLVERVIAFREAENIDMEYGSPIRWLKVTAIPAGAEGSVLVVIRDITESRRIEQIRRDFVANASHELKTPAASIQAAAETLHDAAQDDPAAVQRFASQLNQDARRLSRIVADLLDLSRLETGSELNQDVQLIAVVNDEAERFETAAREAGLTLVIDAKPTRSVRGSARDLSLLVRNLIDNAVRYTHPGGTVRIELSGNDDVVRLAVCDDGVGIPTKDLPRIFERFYRVDRARSRETGGTGLGLAIVRHVAENHGGAVDVTSELGRGSSFVVTLPMERES